jgi:hypothetical protein
MFVFQFETLGKTGREIGAVRDDDENRVCLPVNVEQHAGDDFSGLLIEVPGRFVTQEKSWLHDQRAREGHALFLTARQLTGMVIESLTQSDLLQKLSSTI